jgi:proteic killer suppression protein
MNVRFVDSTLDRLETDPSFDAGFSQAIVRAYRKRMQIIRAAPDERDFYKLKSLHFEKLKGDMAAYHSMRLNDQWRLVLSFEEADSGKIVVIVKVDDYH